MYKSFPRTPFKKLEGKENEVYLPDARSFYGRAFIFEKTLDIYFNLW